MPRSIRKTIIARDSNQILGLVLTVLGLIPIFVVLMNAWTSGVSFLDLSALYRFLWTNRFYIGFGIGFELIYLVIVGTVVIISGLALLARRMRQIEEVTVVTDDLTVTLDRGFQRISGKDIEEIRKDSQILGKSYSTSFPKFRYHRIIIVRAQGS